MGSRNRRSGWNRDSYMRWVIEHVARVINVKKVIIGRHVWSERTKGENGFIKRDMTGNYDLICVKIETPEAFMVGWITEENAWH